MEQFVLMYLLPPSPFVRINYDQLRSGLKTHTHTFYLVVEVTSFFETHFCFWVRCTVCHHYQHCHLCQFVVLVFHSPATGGHHHQFHYHHHHHHHHHNLCQLVILVFHSPTRTECTRGSGDKLSTVQTAPEHHCYHHHHHHYHHHHRANCFWST